MYQPRVAKGGEGGHKLSGSNLGVGRWESFGRTLKDRECNPYLFASLFAFTS